MLSKNAGLVGAMLFTVCCTVLGSEEPEASFSPDPLAVDVSWVDFMDYQGIVQVDIDATWGDSHWLIYVSHISGVVEHVDVDSTTMGSGVYYAITVNGSGEADFLLGVWSYQENVSDAFRLALIWDEDGDGEYDVGEPEKHYLYVDLE
jgi:hypothetical protein